MLLEAVQPRVATGPLLYLATFEGALREEAVALAMKLRNAGLRVDFGLSGKVGKQGERADKAHATYFAAYGDREHASGVLELKNLRLPDGHAGKVTQVPVAELAAWLKLNSGANAPS
jgi:histidyl-tRNA synthetase